MPTVTELQHLRDFFNSAATLKYEFRKKQLQRLKNMVLENEEAIYQALHTDLGKSKEESWVTENGFLLSEINYAIKHLSQWMERVKVNTNLLNFPSKSFIINEPLGVVLIISPWNYPLQLLLNPMVGALAAGNCVVLKASEFAPATSAVIKKMIGETFDKNYVLFTEGPGEVVVPEMMNNFTFDHVFYTGSTEVGRLIYKAAADKLTPVTLELGGKSPCVIEADADIKVAAKRITMTKFSNAGQMCVAPDYVLVHESRKEELINSIIKNINSFYGDASQSEDYGRIINEKQFDRLQSLLIENEVIYGGQTNKDKLFISPTIIEHTGNESRLMKEEIFGPILPVISYKTKEEALAIIMRNKNPLAFYIFTSDKEKEQFWLQSVPFGGGCVNNASWHLTNHNLPFGGRGFSGTGNYHGKFSYDTFSHRKGILKTPTWFDPALKYPPFKGKLKLFKKIIR